MVTFVMESKDADKVVYRYYPENDLDKAYGIISVQLKDRRISLDITAEEDFLCFASADQLNEMRDLVNQMRIENGEAPLTKEELPTATEDQEWYLYADHAIRRIRKEIEKGSVPERGTVAWY